MANSDDEKCFLEGVINYVDPMGFLGGKERIRIPIKHSKHSSLEVLNRLQELVSVCLAKDLKNSFFLS